MKRIFFIVFVAPVAFVSMLFPICGICGCSNRQNVSLVCGKRFDPAHSASTASAVLVSGVPMENPVKTDYSDRYYLFVSTAIDDSCDSTKELQVSKAVYDASKIGSTELTYIR